MEYEKDSSIQRFKKGGETWFFDKPSSPMFTQTLVVLAALDRHRQGRSPWLSAPVPMNDGSLM